MFLSIIFCLYTVIWYQVFLSNTNNLHAVFWIKYSYPIQITCTHSYSIKYSYPIQITCTQSFGIKYSHLIQIICTQSTLLFTHSWSKNNWIHTFPKRISAMWNTIILVEDLNLCRRVHFLRWYPLHHGHLHGHNLRLIERFHQCCLQVIHWGDFVTNTVQVVILKDWIFPAKFPS